MISLVAFPDLCEKPLSIILLDENSTYVTGTEITIDGGWTAW